MKMNKIIFYVTISLIYFFSCANPIKINKDPIPFAYQDKINRFGVEKESTITLKEGKTLKTNRLEIKHDSLIFEYKESGEKEIIQLKNVESIIIKDRIIGLGQGFYIGAGLGTVIGGIEGSGHDMGGLAILGGIVVGGIVGAITGYVAG